MQPHGSTRHTTKLLDFSKPELPPAFLHFMNNCFFSALPEQFSTVGSCTFISFESVSQVMKVETK